MSVRAHIHFVDDAGEAQSFESRLPGVPTYGSCIRYRWHTGAVVMLRVTSVVLTADSRAPSVDVWADLTKTMEEADGC